MQQWKTTRSALEKTYDVTLEGFGELRWNPRLQEWFCVRCGLTSYHSNREDAETELESFECELPAHHRKAKLTHPIFTFL
jgi:hypothetical protein